jgi:phosphoglucosamine mutase
VLAALVKAKRPASEVLHLFDPVPQLLRNVRFAGGQPLKQAAVKRSIADAEKSLNGKGRLVIRPSGTEPVIRVTVEADDEALMRRVLDSLSAVVRAAA